MSDDKLILITGDYAIFDVSSFSGLTFIPPPPPFVLSGTGKMKVNGQMICVEGDESKIQIPCGYNTQSSPQPGAGILTIESLNSDQKAKKNKSGGKPVLLKGSKFKAKFTINSPAINPQAGIPDPLASQGYKGQGEFNTNNNKVKGS